MTPNYICPCCAHRGQLTPELFQTVLEVVARDYRLDPHDVEWGGHSHNRRAMEARNVALYFVRSFSAAMNKDLNKYFHWADSSSNATLRFYQTLERMEHDPHFSLLIERLEKELIGEIGEKKSTIHAISA
jgi:hypothetical protein